MSKYPGDDIRRAPLLAGAAHPISRLHVGSPSSSGEATVHPLLGRYGANADLTADHVRALVLWLAVGALATGGLLLVAGLATAAVMFVMVVAVPAAIARRWSGRRIRRLVDGLPGAVDAIGRSLRSGASLTQALAETASGSGVVARELAIVSGGIHRGQRPTQALQAWVDRVPRSEVRIVAAALSIASRNESGTTQALEGVTQSLRDRATLRAEIRSHSAQAAASMQALVVLPAIFLVIDLIGSQQTVQFLFGEAIGRLCLIAAAALDLVGWWWMSTIVRRRIPA